MLKEINWNLESALVTFHFLSAHQGDNYKYIKYFLSITTINEVKIQSGTQTMGVKTFRRILSYISLHVSQMKSPSATVVEDKYGFIPLDPTFSIRNLGGDKESQISYMLILLNINYPKKPSVFMGVETRCYVSDIELFIQSMEDALLFMESTV